MITWNSSDLGHEHRTTTEIYLHTNNDVERAAINVLDNLFTGVEIKSLTQSHTQAGKRVIA